MSNKKLIASATRPPTQAAFYNVCVCTICVQQFQCLKCLKCGCGGGAEMRKNFSSTGGGRSPRTNATSYSDYSSELPVRHMAACTAEPMLATSRVLSSSLGAICGTRVKACSHNSVYAASTRNRASLLSINSQSKFYRLLFDLRLPMAFFTS